MDRLHHIWRAEFYRRDRRPRLRANRWSLIRFDRRSIACGKCASGLPFRGTTTSGFPSRVVDSRDGFPSAHKHKLCMVSTATFNHRFRNSVQRHKSVETVFHKCSRNDERRSAATCLWKTPRRLLPPPVAWRSHVRFPEVPQWKHERHDHDGREDP